MAHHAFDTESLILKDIWSRISSSPDERLPQIVPQLTNSLLVCKTLLGSANTSSSRDDSGAGISVHKFRTRLSTLLQDRAPEKRWAAIVLIKTSIELGGRETLAASSAWVQGLRNVLSKSDPPATKKLSLITITRIFLLTREYPTLLREITTPALPDYITRCLNLLNSTSPSVKRSLTETILYSFAALLPRHPATFRPHVNAIRTAVLSIIAETPSSNPRNQLSAWVFFAPSLGCHEVAQRVLSQLPFCAPKDAAEEWGKAFLAAVKTAHQTADQVLRAVIEEWDGNNEDLYANAASQNISDEPHVAGPDNLGLPGWNGIHAGSERIIALIGVLTQCAITTTPEAIVFRTGRLLDLITRILSVNLPASTKGGSGVSGLRFNKQVTKGEREELWSVLPSIHIAALALLSALLERFKACLDPVSPLLLDQIIWIFAAERSSSAVRTASYLTVSRILDQVGPALSKPSIEPLHGMLKECCKDLVVDEQEVQKTRPATNGSSKGAKSTSANPDAVFGRQTSAGVPRAALSGLHHAACALMRSALVRLDQRYVARSIRILLERTAILTQDQIGMTASVLNPAKGAATTGSLSSIVPILARCHAESLELDAILRPRMPVISIGERKSEVGSDNDDGMHYEDDLLPFQYFPQDRESPRAADELRDRGEMLDYTPTTDQATTPVTGSAVPTSEPAADAVDPRGTDMAMPDLSPHAPPSLRRERSDEEPALTAPAPKRLRTRSPETVPPHASPVPRAPETAPIVTAGADVTRTTGHSGGNADESDEDFEIPPLVLGRDTDGEDEDD